MGIYCTWIKCCWFYQEETAKILLVCRNSEMCKETAVRNLLKRHFCKAQEKLETSQNTSSTCSWVQQWKKNPQDIKNRHFRFSGSSQNLGSFWNYFYTSSTVIANPESIICFIKTFSTFNFVNNHFDISIIKASCNLNSMEEHITFSFFFSYQLTWSCFKTFLL